MRAVRERLTYANVMATVAVFLALAGAGYAAIKIPRNSVGTKQLKRDAVNSSKVEPGSLKGSDINLATLGTVPTAADAEALGGIAAGSFVTGVTAGSGLTGGGSGGGVTLAVDPAQVQSRVTGNCTGPAGVQSITATGSVTCSPAAAVGDVQSAVIAGVPSGVARFGAVSGATPPATDQDSVTSLSPATDLVARDLSVSVSAAPGTTGSVAGVVLEVNGSTRLACEIQGPTAETTCTDTGSGTVPAGSELVLEVVNGTTTPETFRVGFRLTPN